MKVAEGDKFNSRTGAKRNDRIGGDKGSEARIELGCGWCKLSGSENGSWGVAYHSSLHPTLLSLSSSGTTTAFSDTRFLAYYPYLNLASQCIRYVLGSLLDDLRNDIVSV